MKNKKSIIIFSPKGGVGKTILTMNLGGILSNLNKKVLLIDLDVFNGGLGLLINKDLTSTILLFFIKMINIIKNKYEYKL